LLATVAVSFFFPLETAGAETVKHKRVRSPSTQASAPADAVPATAQPTVTTPPVSAPTSERAADYIVAVVNSEAITNHEVWARAAQLRRSRERQGVSVSSDAEFLKSVLETLITERAQLQQARSDGIKVDDEMLRAAEAAIARQNKLSIEELERRVQTEEGVSLTDFRDDVRRQILISRLRDRILEMEARKITDEQVDAYIRGQPGYASGNNVQEVQLNMAMILLPVPERPTKEDFVRSRMRIDDIRRRLKAGENFSAIAGDYSQVTNRNQDGSELGLRPASAYPPIFVQAVAKAQVGEVIGPIRSPAGYHFLKLVDRRQMSTLPTITVPQTRIRLILLQRKDGENNQTLINRLADFKRRIVSGQASFEALAKQYSQDESAADSGDMGWLVTPQLPADLAQFIDGLGVGEISEPIVTPRGVVLLRVEERRKDTLDSDQQRQLGRNILRTRNGNQAFNTWSREVRGRAWVEYREPPL
jgi:peptidyl-prolyl cis-trans isomerase SurA